MHEDTDCLPADAASSAKNLMPFKLISFASLLLHTQVNTASFMSLGIDERANNTE
jgi:hypothetical protein